MLRFCIFLILQKSELFYYPDDHIYKLNLAKILRGINNISWAGTGVMASVNALSKSMQIIRLYVNALSLSTCFNR